MYASTATCPTQVPGPPGAGERLERGIDVPRRSWNPVAGALRRRSGPDLIGAIPFGPRDHQTPDSDAAPEGRAAGVGELVGERIDCGSLVGKEVLGGFTLCEAIAVSSNSIHGVTAEGPVARAAAG